MSESLYDFCKRTHNTALLREWDYSRNWGCSPRTLTYGSRQKVWWSCEKGHHWQAIVTARTHGTGCPVCANRALLPGENDLATRFPAIAAQWDEEKNAPLTPRDVLAGSRKRVWWRCEKGHRWQGTPLARSSMGQGCPVCAGKLVIPGENDLASHFPALAKQWDMKKNAPLTPQSVSIASNRRVWWQCSFGHVWRTRVSVRTGKQKCGCPVCAGKVKIRDGSSTSPNPGD